MICKHIRRRLLEVEGNVKIVLKENVKVIPKNKVRGM
jgi:hypothetical protein